MSHIAEAEWAHIGETSGCSDHSYDLVQELGRRLDTLWRIDQHIANAQGREKLQKFWGQLKKQEQENVKALKALLAEEVRSDNF